MSPAPAPSPRKSKRGAPHRPGMPRGLRKAAVLLLALPEKLGARVLEHLDKEHVKRVTAAVAALGAVPRLEQQAVVKEFLLQLRSVALGGGGSADRARALIERAFPPDEAAAYLERLHMRPSKGPFAFIGEAGVERVLPFLREEHPQTVALVLAASEPEIGAALLTGMPVDEQADLMRRVAELEPVHLGAARAVGAQLRRRIGPPGEKHDGARVVRHILRAAGKRGVQLFAELSREIPDLAPPRKTARGATRAARTPARPAGAKPSSRTAAAPAKPAMSARTSAVASALAGTPVAELMTMLAKKELAAALSVVEPAVVARALRAAPPDVHDQLLAALPQEYHGRVARRLQTLGPVRVSEAEEALERVRHALLRGVAARTPAGGSA
ncbi:MAG: FliG C-terminal domain-containing protein [Planctomycetota bacterium]